MDRSVFEAVNGLPDTFAPFFVFLSEATKRPAGIAILAVTFIGLVISKKSRRAALTAMLAWPFANAMTDVLKHTLQWPRPSWPDVLAQNPHYQVRVEPLTSFGTASAHSANMMAIAVCFLFAFRPLGWVWLGIAVLTGISRVYVGVHWPSQVLLGWTCGAFMAFVATKTVEAGISVRKSRIPEGPLEAESDQRSQESPIPDQQQ